MSDLAQLEEIKLAKTTDSVEGMLRRRWSPRSFATKDVSDEQIKTLFTAASWAASSYNEQPWRYLLGRRGDAVYELLLQTLIPFNRDWAATAPILFLAVAHSSFGSSGKENGFALHDTGAAGAMLAIQATAMGLHTHSMAGFDPAQARTLFELPSSCLIASVTALGYLGSPEALPEKMQGQEMAPRTRKALHEFLFSKWSTPLLSAE